MKTKYNKAKLPGAKVHEGKTKGEAINKAMEDVRSILEQQHIATTQSLYDQRKARRI